MTKGEIEKAAKEYNDWYLKEYHPDYIANKPNNINAADTWNCFIAGAEFGIDSRQAEIDELAEALKDAITHIKLLDKVSFGERDDSSYVEKFKEILKKHNNE